MVIDFLSTCSDIAFNSWRSKPQFTKESRTKRDKQAFDHIVNHTKNVVVGPLEFCSNARLRYRGGASKRDKFSGYHKERYR